jgi:hypothetical protein
VETNALARSPSQQSPSDQHLGHSRCVSLRPSYHSVESYMSSMAMHGCSVQDCEQSTAAVLMTNSCSLHPTQQAHAQNLFGVPRLIPAWSVAMRICSSVILRQEIWKRPRPSVQNTTWLWPCRRPRYSHGRLRMLKVHIPWND